MVPGMLLNHNQLKSAAEASSMQQEKITLERDTFVMDYLFQ